MSDQSKLAEEVQQLKDQEMSHAQRLNNSPAESLDVNLKVDPVALFQQIERLRKDGVDEATIRAAFTEFIDQIKGSDRQARNSMLRHMDSVPMPSQEEINKLYEDRYKGIDSEITDPSVALIIEEIERSKKAREALAALPKVPLKARAARYLVRKVLATAIFICKLLGVK